MYEEDLAADASAECRESRHVLATPLLDVLYVRVEANKSDDRVRERSPLEIYGTIQLIDEQNYTYDVYRRESNNPETVSHGGNLSLTRLDGTCSSLFLPCVSALKMRVHLRDAAAEGREIAKGDFDIQLMDKTCYHDKIITQVVDGHGAFASIQYATLPYAIIAEVELRLTKNDEPDSDQSHALIYGTISASSKVKEGSISSVLFNRAPSEPIMVDLTAPIELSRYVLAVPAYSCIQIKTDLWDHHTNQQIASDVIVANFDADAGDWDSERLHLGQNYHIKVTVNWGHAYHYVFLMSGYAFDGQKSTLFGDNHHMIVAGGSQLVLQKSVVPVPYGSSLIMDVKLHAQAMCESSQGIRLEHFGSLDEVVDFDVDVDETCTRRIEGEEFVVDVFVEWISE